MHAWCLHNLSHYIYMRTNIPLLLNIWQHFRFDTGHAKGIFWLEVPNFAFSVWAMLAVVFLRHVNSKFVVLGHTVQLHFASWWHWAAHCLIRELHVSLHRPAPAQHSKVFHLWSEDHSLPPLPVAHPHPKSHRGPLWHWQWPASHAKLQKRRAWRMLLCKSWKRVAARVQNGWPRLCRGWKFILTDRFTAQ